MGVVSESAFHFSCKKFEEILFISSSSENKFVKWFVKKNNLQIAENLNPNFNRLKSSKIFVFLSIHFRALLPHFGKKLMPIEAVFMPINAYEDSFNAF